MSLVQPLDMLVAIPRQTNLYVVLAVTRERVVNQRAAASADGQAFEVLLLREIGRDSDGVAAGRTAGPPDCHAADILRGRDITVQQRGGEIADRHIVEAVARLVSWKERGNIDVEREEIANRILVFGSSQPTDRRRAARIRIRFGSTVERFHEIRDHALVRRVVRPRFSNRRHLAPPELPDDLFPDIGMPGYVVSRNRFE